VSIAPCFSVFANRRWFLPALFVTLAGLCYPATAQVPATPPQLLPYTVKLIAGGGKSAIASGATCPSSGFKSTDAFGDGCLGTEILLSVPRYATVDVNGNVFFSDYTNGLVRRVDAISGIVTAVAGGATASPAAGTACGALVSTDIKGNGCLGTAVKLSHPTDLVFSPQPAGDLYFSDVGYGTVRKIAATGGVITTTGVITMIDGQPGATATGGTFGYASNFGTTTVTAATGGYLDDPYGLTFDTSGNLYIADEAKNAIVVVNTNAPGTTATTVAGISIPPGTVAKIVGSPTAGGTTCPNSPASTNGCNFGTFTTGAVANSSQTDAPYGVAVDPLGNVYFANEFLNSSAKITPAGIISLYSGTNNATSGSSLTRAAAGSFATGSDFGIAADSNSNVYVTDAFNGVIWRIDGATQSMYVVAGGVKSTCSASTDAYGDGCPALQAIFGSAPGKGFASSGVYGVSVDAFSDLFVGDTVTNLVREVSSGTQFGPIGAAPPTNIVDIHFAKGDSPAASAYSLIAGGTIFSLGSANCTANSDATTDCLLPITATPTVLGPFAGTLQVKSTLGAVATFPLSGDYVATPETRTAVSASPVICAGNTTFTNATPVTLTATVGSSGSPTGTVTFLANGTAIGTPATVTNSVATLVYTFTTPGTYSITATYSGDSNFTTSTTSSPASVVSSSPTFTTSATNFVQSTVAPGQTALYSFNIASTYIGSIAFTCSGLPANSSCSFSTTSLPVTGCSTTNTVALSILTQNAPSVLQTSIGLGGRGPWSIFATLSGVGLALLIGLRRRRAPLRYGQIWMALALLLAASGTVACGNGIKGAPATPAGTYSILVTATGSAGTTSTFTVPLTVN